MISQSLVLDCMMFLRQESVIEHDRIFVFVYAGSLFKLSSGIWVDAGSRGVSTKGVKNKNLFMRGGRATEF